LRVSYETDIRDHVPDYAADAITGHSAEVSRKHYSRDVPDEVFGRAFAVGSEKSDSLAAVLAISKYWNGGAVNHFPAIAA
jgi:hypothetical protein